MRKFNVKKVVAATCAAALIAATAATGLPQISAEAAVTKDEATGSYMIAPDDTAAVKGVTITVKINSMVEGMGAGAVLMNEANDMLATGCTKGSFLAFGGLMETEAAAVGDTFTLAYTADAPFTFDDAHYLAVAPAQGAGEIEITDIVWDKADAAEPTPEATPTQMPGPEKTPTDTDTVIATVDSANFYTIDTSALTDENKSKIKKCVVSITMAAGGEYNISSPAIFDYPDIANDPGTYTVADAKCNNEGMLDAFFGGAGSYYDIEANGNDTTLTVDNVNFVHTYVVSSMMGTAVVKSVDWYDADGNKVDVAVHEYETTVEPATMEADGAVVKTCKLHEGEEAQRTPIAKIESVDLRMDSFEYAGTEYTPGVIVKDSAGAVITSDFYTISYENNKNVGEGTATVTFKGNYSGTVSRNFEITPQGTKIKTIKELKKGFKVTFAAKKQITGYKIQYSTNKNFKNAKTVIVKADKKVYTNTKLKSGKTYYVRVRTYKTSGGKTYNSSWSGKKQVKTK